jgi:Flp pilus assembly protein TadB
MSTRDPASVPPLGAMSGRSRRRIGPAVGGAWRNAGAAAGEAPPGSRTRGGGPRPETAPAARAPWPGTAPAARGPRRGPRSGVERRGPARRARRLGVGASAGAALAVLATTVPRCIPVLLVAGVAWPVVVGVARRRAAARRTAVQRDAAPAVLDLLGAALLAGLNPHKAVLRVAERAPEALHEDLGLAAAVLRLGGTPTAALRTAADRSGLDELRAAAAALEAAERWGAPPAEALAARAEALRSRARLQAEAEAGRAAVRLAFPLVLCFLPAFVLLTVVPTVAGALRAVAP